MTDAKFGKDPGQHRTARAMTDRGVTEDRQRTDAVRGMSLMESYSNDILPDLPPIPGYHICWVSTIDPRDNPQRRQRAGYAFVGLEDLPETDRPFFSSLKSASIPGADVSVNELVAMKVPSEAYEAYMQKVHGDKPDEEDDKMRALAETLAENAERASGKKAEVGTGFGGRSELV